MTATVRPGDPLTFASAPVPVRAPVPGARYSARPKADENRSKAGASGNDGLGRITLLLAAAVLWCLVALEIVCLALVSA